MFCFVGCIILASADHHHLGGDADGDVVVDAGERLRKDLMFVSGLYRGSMLCFAGGIILATADHHHLRRRRI
jgi:hypothetical protein